MAIWKPRIDERPGTRAAALVEAPPHLKRDGGFVKPGYRAELDEALKLRDESRQVMATLEARYIAETGIKSLKVRHNNILGFFIEVTQGNAAPLLAEPLSATFRHRQTMASAVRFSTAELIETWCRTGAQEIADSPGPAVEAPGEIERDLGRRLADLHAVADRIYARWMEGLA